MAEQENKQNEAKKEIEASKNLGSLGKEERIRKVAPLYYLRPDIRKAMFEFSKNRECVPRYFEGFGKRPDACCRQKLAAGRDHQCGQQFRGRHLLCRQGED